jgi:hypothetical protein
MKTKGRVMERDNQERLERFNTQLHRLRSIQTATKKRRALKRVASSPALTRSPSAQRAQDCMSTPLKENRAMADPLPPAQSFKAHLGQIERIDKRIDHSNRVVLVNEIIEAFGQ